MAEPTDSSLAFFTKGTPKQWAFVYELRQAAIRAKADQRSSKKGGPEEFIKLDNWFREKLPQLLATRKEVHLIYEELVMVAKWRLMMGKYRPKNLDLVRINTESSVKSVTRKALKKISAQKNLQQAITMMVNLKGIGPSTASAVLAAAYPEEAPFMSDEGMLSTPGVEATDSTIAEYVNYSEQLRNKNQWLQKADPDFKWTPHKVDQALWIYYIARDLKPQLLDAMPKGDDEVSTSLNTSGTASSSMHDPTSDAADDNANDCTSSSGVTNGSSHYHNGGNEDSASVPYSEEDFSQGGEASCSSSIGAGSLSLNGLSAHHVIESTTSTLSPPVSTTTTNGTKRSLGGEENNHSHLHHHNNNNNNNHLNNHDEDSSSQNGLIDSEDSRGEAGMLLMMTPSEENSIDDAALVGSCGGDSQDGNSQPPLKKQKTLELGTAFAAATAAEEV